MAAGTLVHLVRDGFAGIGTPGWAATWEAYERGAGKHQVLQRPRRARSGPRENPR